MTAPRAFVFLALWALYVLNAAPHISTGDSGELAAAGVTLGVAHSPGYPLYVLAGKTFVAVMPWGNPAYALDLFSGFCAALALALVGAGTAWLPAAGLVLLGAGPLFVKLSGTAEVFGLNILAAAILWRVLGGATASLRRRGMWAAFVFGLGLANQQTLLLVGPALALWFWWEGKRSFFRSSLAPCAAALALGLSLYAFLYVRSQVQPLLDWEDPGTLERFWSVLRRARYGTLQLAQGAAAAWTWERSAAILKFVGMKVHENLGTAGLCLLAAGAVEFYRTRRREAAALTVAFILSGPLFLLWANSVPGAANGEILERFLLLPLFLLAGPAAAGGSALWAKNPAARAAAIALTVWWVAAAAPPALRAAARWDTLARDHGLNILRNAPEGALLVTDRADETEFALAFLLYAEGRRADLDFVDANAGVSRSRYGEDYYGIWGAPRLGRRQEIEGRWLASGGKPFFYATLDVGQLRLPRRAAGLLHEADAAGRFGARTLFPYGEVLLLRRPAEGTARSRHLLRSTGVLLGDYALGLGRASEAERFFRLAEISGGTSWHLNMAAWRHRQGRREEAEALYRALLERPGKWPEAWNNLGVLLSEKGMWKEALACYGKAVVAKPSYAEAHYNAGVAYWNLGDWANVVRAFEAALALDPAHDRAARYLGEARRRLEKRA